MLALIMAGGAGRRLNLGEKPLVNVCGRPMIAYVCDAFRKAGYDVVVVLAPGTPYTRNWCNVHGVDFVVAEGRGYIDDLIEAVVFLEEEAPLFTCVADLPCITAKIISRISGAYNDGGKDACSVWIPLSLCKATDSPALYRESIDGVGAVPAGINILRGDRIQEPQEETALLLYEARLAYQVNTREDLAIVRHYLCKGPEQASPG